MAQGLTLDPQDRDSKFLGMKLSFVLAYTIAGAERFGNYGKVVLVYLVWMVYPRFAVPGQVFQKLESFLPMPLERQHSISEVDRVE